MRCLLVITSSITVPNMVSQLSKAKFPILLGNIYYTDTNKPVWDHPWTIIEKDGLKIGVIDCMAHSLL